MTMPPRFVSVLVPVQLTMLLLGFAICHKMVPLHDRFFSEMGVAVGFPPMPMRFMNKAGWLLSLLPIAWGVAACLRAENVGPVTEVRSLDSRVGLGLLVFLAVFSFWCVVRSTEWAFGMGG